MNTGMYTGSAPKVLVVDDDPHARASLEISLGRMKLHSQGARNLHEARGWLARERFDLCLADPQLPDGSALTLLPHLQQCQPQTPLALISTSDQHDSTTRALEAGAFEVLGKPVAPGRLRELVNHALAVPSLPATGNPLLGESPPMLGLRRHIDKLARSLAAIYISGESGSGKERVARLIHERGPRARRPFVAVNCGAIPSELMESEFFGHRKGSFSGAIDDRPGLFQAAQGGTLFLDEIADLPLAMQVKLLRVLQEKTVRSIGNPQETRLDVRVLCATHKALEREVAAGRFRQDLYYRLNVIELRVPPLRERQQDIPLLASGILQRLAKTAGQPPMPLTPQALQALLDYPFPGNVRELENILERAHTLCDAPSIGLTDLHLAQEHRPLSGSGTSVQAERIDLPSHLLEVERQLIVQALQESRWNRTAAAQRLGLSFRSMRYRMEKLGLG
jgi:two-component system response regulator PilR (NtrC family)